MALMDLEIEILHDIPLSGVMRSRAYAVWTDRDGNVQVGPVRARRADSGDQGGYRYECSPFPGAWDWHVHESQMLRVRHLGAMSLQDMACVCPGSVWDSHCPSPECTTPRREGF